MPDGEFLPTHKVELPANVRLARVEDEAQIFDLLVQFYRDDPPATHLDQPFSKKRAMDTIQAATRERNGVIGFIQDSATGRFIATIGIYKYQSWWTEAWSLHQAWIYVHPDYRRGTHHARDLFRFAEWFRQEMASAEGMGGNCLLFSDVVTDRLWPKIRLWLRFAKQIGAVFVIGHREF